MKYAIYDNKSDVITPIGEVLTAEQWLTRYPWAKNHKMIVGGGVINGNVALVFDDTIATFTKLGADFESCTTDEEYLAAIEKFEDETMANSSATISNQERIANALEDLVVLQMPDVTTDETNTEV